MSNSVQCDGCKRPFTPTGFTSHLRQTQSPACIAVRRKREDRFRQEILAQHVNPPPPSQANTAFLNIFESQPQAFVGDYFGPASEYTLESLGQARNDVVDVGIDDDSRFEGEGWFDDDEMSLDEEGDSWAGVAWEHEEDWEAPRTTDKGDSMDIDSDVGDENSSIVIDDTESAAPSRISIHDRMRANPYITRFPGGKAGMPIVQTYDTSERVYEGSLGGGDVWQPFVSRRDWEVARWAKLRGPGAAAFNEFLHIEGVQEALGLSFRTSEELNRKIDSLPGRPKFQRSEIVVAGESFEVYFRDIKECIRALWRDQDFLPYLVFAPERHYADEDKTIRLYHNMQTGKWWWATQKAVEEKCEGATIIPIILSSDKTQLTVFGNKTAYPVYLTIGNLPKEIRRKPSRHGYILLAYLPTSKLKHIKNKSARRRCLANLFHKCMTRIVEPIVGPGEYGMEVISADGIARRGHPILACYVADYQEQVLVTGTMTGDCCTCGCENCELQNCADCQGPRDVCKVRDILASIKEGPSEFHKACRSARLKPIAEPFWTALPYTNIFSAMTPDILHQLYQGVIKHLISWVKQAVGKEEIDARCRRLPPMHGMRLFFKGISGLSRVTGKEHSQIASFLISLVIGARLPGNLSPSPLIRAVRAILDFLYLAQYPLHTTETLELLKDALKRWHDNRYIFDTLGIRSHFNIPKFHSLEHYVMYITYFGTTDNYNTEYTERLHIELTKDAYRSTNFKDEIGQMTIWLERQEKVHRHSQFVERKCSTAQGITMLVHEVAPGVTFDRSLKMARHPSRKYVPFTQLANEYGANFFEEALSRWIVGFREPDLSLHQIELRSSFFSLPFSGVPVYHNVKYTAPDIYNTSVDDAKVIVENVHVTSPRANKKGQVIPGRFDTVLVQTDSSASIVGIRGCRVAQVRVVFTLPEKVRALLFGIQQDIPQHLAYVEWFSAFKRHPEPNHLMYKVTRSVDRDGHRISAVIPVTSIRQGVQLFPDFGPVAPAEWTSSNVLESCKAFFVSDFSSRHAYHTVI